MAKAIRYSTSRWTALTRFVDDGRLELTNNAAERAMRPLCLARKNDLFAGSDAGPIHLFQRIIFIREVCNLAG